MSPVEAVERFDRSESGRPLGEQRGH
jgi:hypothetical protein